MNKIQSVNGKREYIGISIQKDKKYSVFEYPATFLDNSNGFVYKMICMADLKDLNKEIEEAEIIYEKPRIDIDTLGRWKHKTREKEDTKLSKIKSLLLEWEISENLIRDAEIAKELSTFGIEIITINTTQKGKIAKIIIDLEN